MGKIMCPGQDTAFWRPGDIFEVACSECGNEIEFFKDDASRRCSKCGRRVSNPKLNLGCAQWCEHAKECLGYDPKEGADTEGGESALVDRLVAAMKAEFGDDQKRITHALNVLDYAAEIMRSEGGSPRVILAAAVLHDIGIHAAEQKHSSSAGRFQEKEGPPIAEPIMRDLGMDVEAIDHVKRIIANHHSARDIDTLEFRILWDADWLVNIPDMYPNKGPEEMKKLIEKVFKTKTGKDIAHRLYT